MCRVEWSVRDLAAEAAHADGDEHAEREDDRGVPEREEEPDAERPLALAHELARGVVDRGDVVGVEGVAQPQRVGRDPHPETEHAAGTEAVVVRHYDRQQQEEADDVQADDDRGEHRRSPPLRRRQRRSDAPPA